MRAATLADRDEIHALLNTAQAEILPVPKAEVTAAIVEGRCLWENGVAMIYRRNLDKSYYGVPLPVGAFQVMQLIARDKGTGAARSFMEGFFLQTKATVYLLVISDNHRAIKFYNKLGFEHKKTLTFKSFSSNLMVRYA